MKPVLYPFILSGLLVLNGCGDGPAPANTNNQQPVEPNRDLPPALVDANWLNQHADDLAIRILDMSRSRLSFERGHIPGALYVDWEVDIIDPESPEKYMVLPADMMEDLMSRLGIDKQTMVILYDDMSSRIATRMFWTMRYYNHEKIRILDGGRSAWSSAGYDFAEEPSTYPETAYAIDRINHDLLVEKSYIESRLEDQTRFALVDGRPFDQYTGKLPGVVFHTGAEHKRRGHIYGAQSVPWGKNFNEDGTFKPIEALRLLYEPHHITRDKTIVTYCNEGLHAAPPWFVLTQLLNYPDVRLYDASMAEWANDENTRMIEGGRCM